MMVPILSIYLQHCLAVSIGIHSHYYYFRQNERDLAAARIATFHFALLVFITISRSFMTQNSVWQNFKYEVSVATAYGLGLFSSMTVYRVFLSPLRHIRGPLRLKLSKLTHVWDMARRQNCVQLEELRKIYGDIVRTGPSEVTIFGSEAYYQVHGPNSKCSRAAYYDLLHPMVSLDTTRDKTVHDHRRRFWDQAFSIKSLVETESMVYDHAHLLCAELEKRMKEPLDISIWLEYYTFDLMGLFGLSIDFGNLTKGEHHILSLYHMAHKKLGPLAAAPWIKHLLMGIHYIKRMKYYRQFMDWAHDELETNIKENKRKNVIGYVIEDAMTHGGLKKNWNYVLGDFVLVIVAGSDPVRQVLANMMYYLIKYPEHLVKIRKELSSVDIRDYRELQRVEHLNSCIYETLRLNPAVPSAGLRLPPKGGMTVNDTYIPEGTTIVTPQFSVLRDERNFERPLDWIPERFSARPSLIINKSAYIPWSIGKMSCVGKNLSLMEIRIAAALLIDKFDCAFAPGEDGSSMFTEATDYFTTTPGPLRLLFKLRSKEVL